MTAALPPSGAPLLQAALLALLAAPAQARDPILAFPLACGPGAACVIAAYPDHDHGPGAADFTCGPHSRDGLIATEITASATAPVQAAAPGTVRDGAACPDGVLIDHGSGWTTEYCGLAATVAPGRRLGAGAALGTLGAGAVLAFTVRRDGAPVDPFVPDGIVLCGETPAGSLWRQGRAYDPPG